MSTLRTDFVDLPVGAYFWQDHALWIKTTSGLASRLLHAEKIGDHVAMFEHDDLVEPHPNWLTISEDKLR